jgi:ATP-dependent exoDNAse (exonuclease V) beta subunit
MLEETRAKVVCSTVHKAKGLEYYAVMLPHIATTIGSTKFKGQTDVIVMGNGVGYSLKDSDNKVISNDIYQSFKEQEAHYRRDEEARILYVAMTRTKRRLIFFDEEKYAKTVVNPSNWEALLRGKSCGMKLYTYENPFTISSLKHGKPLSVCRQTTSDLSFMR